MAMIATLLHKVASHPAVYDRIQSAVGFRTVGAFIQPHLERTANGSVLDIGAGTGNFRPFMPSTANYFWTDCDPLKLDGYRLKYGAANSALADATQLCYRDSSIDYAFCAAVSHHLTDPQLDRLFAEVARVVRHRFIFCDAVATDRILSRLMWHYDRGSHPRTIERLLAALSRHFRVEHHDHLTIYHRYLLCVASPLR